MVPKTNQKPLKSKEKKCFIALYHKLRSITGNHTFTGDLCQGPYVWAAAHMTGSVIVVVDIYNVLMNKDVLYDRST